MDTGPFRVGSARSWQLRSMLGTAPMVRTSEKRRKRCAEKSSGTTSPAASFFGRFEVAILAKNKSDGASLSSFEPKEGKLAGKRKHALLVR